MRRREAMRHGPLALRLFSLGLALCAAELASFYWKAPIGPRGVTAADVADLASTYAIVLLYGWVVRGVWDSRARVAGRSFPGGAGLLLALAAVTWILGRGVHVAANSLHDWLGHTGAADARGLFTFWDETLGHLLTDAGTIGFAIGITRAENAGRREPAAGAAAGPAARSDGPRGLAWIVAGALAYGFIYFAGGVEGRTVPLTLPWSAAYVVWALAAARGRAAQLGARPARLFFAIAFAAALALFIAWGAWRRGFPEFSATGFGP